MGVEFWATGFEGLVSGYENLFCFRYRGVRAPWRQRRDSRPRVQGPGFRVQRSEFRVQGPGFRVQGVRAPWSSDSSWLTITIVPP